MVNVKSVADSATNAKSTGHIYLLLIDVDLTARDLKVNNKVTVLFGSMYLIRWNLVRQ